MAGADGVAAMRPSPELLRVPPTTADAAGGKEVVVDTAGSSVDAQVAAETTPYSVSISVAPSGEVRKLDVRHPDAAGEPNATATSSVDEDVAVQVSDDDLGQPTLTIRSEEPPPPPQQQQEHGTVARSDSQRDRRFDHFKTFIRGGGPAHPTTGDNETGRISEDETDDDDGELPTADRYFAALEGPELETLRPSEVPVLPEGEPWPFLLRFPISAFGMCMGVSSQAMLWKTLEHEHSMAFLHVSPRMNDAFWWASVALMGVVSAIYLLKAVFYLEAVRREFHHPIRVNFFFAPWIACLFLAKGEPRPEWTIHHVVWYVLMAPLFLLDLKIYGQWMSGGEWRLSRVANPTSHLAVVGNFVGALLGARMGLRESATFFFAVGLVHYLVLFVTLYQRLPTNVPLPRELHPVFFLFIATPSVASVAWARICSDDGQFNLAAKLAYYISLFLYASLVARVKFFRGVRFSLAWWAYTFPMTSAAIATAVFASSVTNAFTRSLAVALAAVASVTVAGVLATTVYRAFVRRDLFPNDVSIAISRRPKAKIVGKILARLRTSSAELRELVARHGGSEGSSARSVSAPPTPARYGCGAASRAEP